ncbi:MAG: T9SS type A sorting domain-containing protein [Bacteroidales bacterium]|nr:MAG: T9SS type A sorting domain-containing protein [Bacteroidales bacterium]
MKRFNILFLLTGISFYAFGQSSNSSCCSCYNFFSDDNTTFLRDSTIHYLWDENNNGWKENVVSVYFYDDMAKIREHIMYKSAGGIPDRIPVNMHTYVYDVGQRRFERVGYRWDIYENQWMKVNKAVYQYDSAYLLYNRVDYLWSNSTDNWVNDFAYNYSFDRKGENFNTSTEKWDAERNMWFDDSKSEISITGNRKTRIIWHWDPARKTWRNFQQMIHSYSTDGLLISRKLNTWNEELGKWEDFRDYAYFYDRKGWETEWISYGWDDRTGSPEGKGRQLYSYDDYGNKIETLRFAWDRESGEWTIREKQITWWSSLLMAEFEDLKPEGIKVYPNPFEDYVTIELDDYENTRRIELIDISGRIVRIIENVSHPSIIMKRDNLQSGMYILKIYARRVVPIRLMIE